VFQVTKRGAEVGCWLTEREEVDVAGVEVLPEAGEDVEEVEEELSAKTRFLAAPAARFEER
jgi:hypothetical protein